ncbi:Hsp33 family molecular chaperone HslO [Arenibaculum sp.]|uniref:Hsp33 family molecular chaperone HslO n=1 Tax=Arenibaculum sp. TaxID=2865862 RepID=UPI002E12504E|nr:Hsp33 family molecular chaperone HslO [Arenibaculum sp.]
MTYNERPLDDDVIQTFQLDTSHLRGRFVRLGGVLDEILSRHAYPEPVADLLGQTITLAVALAGMLKYDGIFTLQAKGDGPVGMIVADVTSAGDLRGYAHFDEDRVADLAPGANSIPALLGKGYLAFTVDQGENTERYQGIVELTGATLTESVNHYFRQSEQLETGMTVTVARQGSEGEGWRGGALLLQRMPEEGGTLVRASDDEDDWRRAMVLMSSATPAELTDPRLPANDLLFRLFHEEGVRVWPPVPVRAGCRCSRERVSTVLRSLPRSEIEELKVDGQVQVTCQFCSNTYGFDDGELARVYEG